MILFQVVRVSPVSSPYCSIAQYHGLLLHIASWVTTNIEKIRKRMLDVLLWQMGWDFSNTNNLNWLSTETVFCTMSESCHFYCFKISQQVLPSNCQQCWFRFELFQSCPKYHHPSEIVLHMRIWIIPRMGNTPCGAFISLKYVSLNGCFLLYITAWINILLLDGHIQYVSLHRHPCWNFFNLVNIKP